MDAYYTALTAEVNSGLKVYTYSRNTLGQIWSSVTLLITTVNEVIAEFFRWLWIKNVEYHQIFTYTYPCFISRFLAKYSYYSTVLKYSLFKKVFFYINSSRNTDHSLRGKAKQLGAAAMGYRGLKGQARFLNSIHGWDNSGTKTLIFDHIWSTQCNITCYIVAADAKYFQNSH